MGRVVEGNNEENTETGVSQVIRMGPAQSKEAGTPSRSPTWETRA